MNIYDSMSVSNHIKLRSILIVIIVFLFIAAFSAGILLIPCVIMWIAAHLIANKEIRAVSENSTEFKKSYPFRYFGLSYGDFTHVFHHTENLEREISETINTELRTKTPMSDLQEIAIIDIDNDLRQRESRTFQIANSPPTKRGTTVTLLLRFASFGSLQIIQWWVLGGGYVDRDKRFNFVAYSPFLMWFWLLPYLRRSYDLLPAIRTVYSSTYNHFDVDTQVRCAHEAVFCALIDELERNGVDTSAIKVQRMQLMNINISGGTNNIGNVMQGVANKVMTSSGGSAK